MTKTTKPTKNESSYQPTKADLEADASIPTTPDALLRAAINYDPRKGQ